jgi:hypothetical protein
MRDLSLLITHAKCSIQRMADVLQSEPGIGREFRAPVSDVERVHLSRIQFELLERDLPDLTEPEKSELKEQLGAR